MSRNRGSINVVDCFGSDWMHPYRLSLAVLVTSLILAGCQTASESNPFQYQFNSPEDNNVCLYVSSLTSPMVARNVRTALEEKGLVVTEVDQETAHTCERCVHFTSSMGGWSGERLEQAAMEIVRRHGDKVTTQGIVTMSVSPANMMNASSDDQMMKIRGLVDRLFPDPVLWNVH